MRAYTNTHRRINIEISDGAAAVMVWYLCCVMARDASHAISSSSSSSTTTLSSSSCRTHVRKLLAACFGCCRSTAAPLWCAVVVMLLSCDAVAGCMRRYTRWTTATAVAIRKPHIHTNTQIYQHTHTHTNERAHELERKPACKPPQSHRIN